MRYIHYRFIKIFFLVATFTFFNVSAGNSFGAVRSVSGYGATKKEAVVNGLIEAIRQIKGVKVDSEEVLKNNFAEIIKVKNGDKDDQLTLAEQQSRNIITKSKGLISSYKVVYIRKNEEGIGYEALLKVEIPVYKEPGLSADSRRKLVVMPFRANTSYFPFEERKVTPREASQILSQALISEFSQSRRFAVLDREFVNEILAEKKIITSPDASIKEQAKLGKVLGVDYMIVGTIKDAGFERYSREMKLTGQVQSGWYAHTMIDYRIILMATRQVKWANTVQVEMGPQDTPEIGAYGDPQKISELLFQTAAKSIAEEALGNIYPIQIVSGQDNGEYVLNQGGNGLSPGNSSMFLGEEEDCRSIYQGVSWLRRELGSGT